MVRAYVCLYLEEYADARAELDIAAVAARASGNERRLAAILSNISVIDVIDGDLEGATYRLQEAQKLAARMGDQTTLLYANINLGLVAIQAGDHTRARIRYREALLLNMSGGDLIAIQGLLLGLALCSTAGGELPHAAVLHGVVDAAYAVSQTVLDPTEVALMHEDQARLRELLGESGSPARWNVVGVSPSPRRSSSQGARAIVRKTRRSLPERVPVSLASPVVRAARVVGSARRRAATGRPAGVRRRCSSRGGQRYRER